MSVAVSYPGIYVQEIPSGVRTIVGVGTSIGLFVGRALKGELYQPVQCLSVEDFERAFTSQYAGGALARQVRLFFQNGGTQCYVQRIGDELAAVPKMATAKIQLLAEDGATMALEVSARSPGAMGNDLRLAVNYNTVDPESSFNLEIFRWTKTSTGALQKADTEYYVGLDMNPQSPRFVKDIIEQQSKLVTVTAIAAPPGGGGFSLMGRPVASKDMAALRDEVVALFGGTGKYQFRLSVDGGTPQMVDLGDLDFTAAPLKSPAGATFDADLAKEIAKLINAKVSPAAVTVDVVAGPAGQAGKSNATTTLFKISSKGSGDVRVTPAGDPAQDISAALMLGTSQGGVEVSRFASIRPAPNGLVFNPKYAAGSSEYVKVAALLQDAFDQIVIGGTAIALGTSLKTTPVIAKPVFFQDASSTQGAPPDPVSDGVREKWAIIAAAIQSQRTADPDFPWTAELWGSRLAILPAAGVDNLTATVKTLTTTDIGGKFNTNTRYYSVGTTGLPGFQTNGADGVDSGPPSAADYQRAYLEADREIDLFNLLVLPKDDDHNDATTRMLWGPASLFCQRRRALLIMDPPADWTDSQAAVSPAKGVNTLRVGLVKDFAAVFHPNVKINEGGRDIYIGPSGAIAGLMGRIDGTRGVWKAPAGTEADLRGITGVQYKFTDGENGVMNPKAVNTIRVFPNGIVNWGARTMDGDDGFGSEYKYIPIRRLALYIEESLYRGLNWVVFEPNDEALWAQIRLNVGAFMNNLFRQGAFQGQMPKDAYFVKCDASTTTQNDRNLGIVNIAVGFAPLKPAEFVVLTLQQMAGQIQV